MSDTTLEQVYERYKHMTDKGTLHSYIPIYHELWAGELEKIAAVLEIGVQSGGSLMLWRDYFPYAAIHGIDIADCPTVAHEDRITFHKMNVMDRTAIEMAFDEKTTFDIIIDDASHKIEEQLRAVAFLWRYLRPGGWYVVEDILDDRNLILFDPIGASRTVLDFVPVSHKTADRMVVIRKAW